MPETAVVELPLLDWRREVADIYAAVRSAAEPAQGHALWRTRRDALFRSSPASPLTAGSPLRAAGLAVPAYDAGWRVEVPLEVAEPERRDAGEAVLERIGRLRTPWGSLDAWWVNGYAGGLFVPVRDWSAGRTSYGGGRYLLDTAKGADLGSTSLGFVLDLNFLYHPSCRYDGGWACPLAPPGNVLEVSVPVGEQLGADVAT